MSMQKTKRSPFGDLNAWQGRKDSNSGHPVLETGVLPTELHPYWTLKVYHKFLKNAIPF